LTSSVGRLLLRRLESNTSSLIRQRPLPGAVSVAGNIVSYNNRRPLSSPSSAAMSTFAVVDHGKLYEQEMAGGHGQQLALAELEGVGKDDPVFDPFALEDAEEAQFLRQLEGAPPAPKELDETSEDDVDDDDYDDEEDISDYDDDDEEEDAEDKFRDQLKEFKLRYNNDGSLRRTKSQLATLRAGAPAGGKFAVIDLGDGTQHKVTTDDLVICNKLKGPANTENRSNYYKIGSVHTLTNEQVLLVGSTHQTLVGMPFVPNAEVDILIEEITSDAKIVVFKKRRRKNSQRKNGFRRKVTFVRILDIRFPEPYQSEDKGRPRVLGKFDAKQAQISAA